MILISSLTVLFATSLARAPRAHAQMETADAGAQARLPEVTIDAIITRSPMKVRDVRWFDEHRLIATVSHPGESSSQAQLIELDGALGATIGEGRLAAVAPGGGAILHRGESEWILSDMETGERTSLPDPSDDDRAFRAYRLPEWSPDGRFVVVGERFHQRYVAPEAPQHEHMIADVPILEYDIEAAERGLVESRITVFDRSNPRAVRRFYIDDTAVKARWAPDGTLYILRMVNFDDDPYTEILALSPGGEELKEVYRTRGRFQSMLPAMRPSGDLLAVVLDADNRRWEDFQSIVLVDPASGEEVRRLTRDLPISGSDYVWSRDGGEIYARVRRGGLDEIWAIPIEGEPRRLASGLRRHYGFSVSPSGRQMAYQTEDGYGRNDIRVLDLEAEQERVVLVAENPNQEFHLGEWRQVRWTSSDGVRPFGHLVLPPDFDPTRKYPMLVDVHGGGPGSWAYLRGAFTIASRPGPLEWHAWAALGYVVFAPDYRSTGDYGAEVIAASLSSGEPQEVGDAEDVVAGVRHMIDQGFVDPDRIALLGHSAGGARAFLALTREPDLFAAGVLNDSMPPGPMSTVVSLLSNRYAGGASVGTLRAMYYPDLPPSSDAERFKTNYLFDAWSITTPTLIMMTDESLSGGIVHWPFEVIFSILRGRGVPVRMFSFPGETHGYSAQAARVAFEETRTWLEVYAPPGESEETH